MVILLEPWDTVLTSLLERLAHKLVHIVVQQLFNKCQELLEMDKTIKEFPLCFQVALSLENDAAQNSDLGAKPWLTSLQEYNSTGLLFPHL